MIQNICYFEREFSYKQLAVLKSIFRAMGIRSVQEIVAGMPMLLMHYCKMNIMEKSDNNRSSDDWECQCRMWSDRQQEHSLDNYIDRDIIVGLQSINPSLQRQMCFWEFSGAQKPTSTGYRDMEKSNMVNRVIFHWIFNKWPRAWVTYVKRTVTTNQYNVLLTLSPLSYDQIFRSRWEWTWSSRIIISPSTGHKCTLMSKKGCKSYAMVFTLTRSHSNWN